VLLSALPTAALVFTLAQQYGIYVDRASSAILVTTLLSVLTVPLILLILGMSRWHVAGARSARPACDPGHIARSPCASRHSPVPPPCILFGHTPFPGQIR
jgi:hypothetical protein